MALIKCPECGSEISDKASNCPKCGCPAKKENNEKKALNKKVILITLFILLIIFVAIFVLRGKFGKGSIIMGEWNFVGVSIDGDTLTAEQAELFGESMQGYAFFDEENFVFSFQNTEAKGTWEEINNGDKSCKYYRLRSDIGKVAHATIYFENTNLLYISLPMDKEMLIIYEK